MKTSTQILDSPQGAVAYAQDAEAEGWAVRQIAPLRWGSDHMAPVIVVLERDD